MKMNIDWNEKKKSLEGSWLALEWMGFRVEGGVVSLVQSGVPWI